jgi:hypothetical protein
VAVRARERAGEAFEQYLNERGAKPLPAETAAFLTAGGAHGILAGDLLELIAGMGYRFSSDGEAPDALRQEASNLQATFEWLADRLSSRATNNHAPPLPARDRLRGIERAALSGWQQGAAAAPEAISTVMVGEWIEMLATLCHDLKRPVALAAETARVPWWR